MKHPLDFAITGIPRSGTSLLTLMFNHIEGFAAVNEPDMRGLLTADRRPDCDPIAELTALYGELRHAITEGLPVQHKPTDDTFVAPERVPSIYPRTSSSALRLATKNTIEYLVVLPELVRLAAGRPILAMVRHPVDTIDAWIRSFRHLRHSRTRTLPRRFLSPAQRHVLDAVIVSETPEQARARLWCFFAGSIIEFREHLTIVRYEDLVASPASTLARAMGIEQTAVGAAASVPRPPRRPQLDPSEVDCIADICRPLAEQLGYAL